jgi:protein SCO1/2
VKPVFISVDPARDCLAQMKHYGQDFHKDFVYLTGTNEQVAAAARNYRVYFSKVGNFVYWL